MERGRMWEGGSRGRGGDVVAEALPARGKGACGEMMRRGPRRRDLKDRAAGRGAS